MIIHTHITYSQTYSSVELMICITIDNGSTNTVGGTGYSAHQAVSRFAEDHIELFSYVHRKCKTQAWVSGDINKSFECVTIANSKLSDVVVV